MFDLVNRRIRKVPVWPFYLIGAALMAGLFWQGVNGALGADPVKALEHKFGEIGLQLLVGSLAITPLRRFTGLNLIKFRRVIGVMCFFYIGAHLLVWLRLDVGDLGLIWADIVKRPYITVGMGAFVLMIPLAVTSNNWALRKLGPSWRRLHRLTYSVGILGAVHFVLLVKGFQIEPLVYFLVILALLAIRIPKLRQNLSGPSR